MQSYIWVAIGGALGSVARYWCSGVVARLIGETFPWGTLIVNVSGCLIIGFFATITGPDGRLLQFPAREKRKIVVLGHIAQRFETGRRYTEKEVNGLIDFPDHATVRRYLIEYGFLARSQDCSQYWRKEQN